MDLLFKLLLLPLAHWLLNTYMFRYRNKVKTGDVVGIQFSSECVANRTVYLRLQDSVVALDEQARNYKYYPISAVFLKDNKSSTDISIYL